MRRLTALAGCVAVLLLASQVVAVGDEPVGEVLVLDDANFDTIVPQHEVLLVEFYAPWCGHCKALEPKYNEAAKALGENPETAHIRIAKMDADAQKKVPGRFGVSGFPTIKLFRNGEAAGDFEGDRTAEGIIDFMKKKAATSVNKAMTDAASLKKLFKNPANPTLIAICSSIDHVDYKYYKAVVSKLADTGIDIFHSVTPSVLEAFGFYGNGCTIQLARPSGKPAKVTYKGTVFKDKLREWVLSNVITPFAKYTPDSQKLFTQLSKNIIRIVRAPNAAPLDMKALEEVAKKYEATFNFAVSDADAYKSDVEAHCDKGATTCVLAHDVKKNKIFGMDGSAATAEAVTAFIEAFNAKSLKQKIKSEAAPAPAKAGEVATLVGSTFQEAMDSDKDLFIEFYAPWCGHCKALAPKYDALAKEFESEFDTLSIAKIDLTNNDLPSEYKDLYAVSGFPTLYWAPKGAKNRPVKFEGGREVADMKKWIEDKRKK